MEIVHIVSQTITLPNITVEEKYIDGVLKSHRLTANAGYVMYDRNANDTEWNEDLQEYVPVTYYYRQVTIPVRIPVENWGYEAVMESTVDENYIFGVGDNNHEVM